MFCTMHLCFYAGLICMPIFLLRPPCITLMTIMITIMMTIVYQNSGFTIAWSVSQWWLARADAMTVGLRGWSQCDWQTQRGRTDCSLVSIGSCCRLLINFSGFRAIYAYCAHNRYSNTLQRLKKTTSAQSVVCCRRVKSLSRSLANCSTSQTRSRNCPTCENGRRTFRSEWRNIRWGCIQVFCLSAFVFSAKPDFPRTRTPGYFVYLFIYLLVYLIWKSYKSTQ